MWRWWRPPLVITSSLLLGIKTESNIQQWIVLQWLVGLKSSICQQNGVYQSGSGKLNICFLLSKCIPPQGGLLKSILRAKAEGLLAPNFLQLYCVM